MAAPILKYFEYDHLPVELQTISEPLCRIAKELDRVLADGPEKSAGLRKLLEAKDCFVRSALGDALGNGSPRAPWSEAPGDAQGSRHGR